MGTLVTKAYVALTVGICDVQVSSIVITSISLLLLLWGLLGNLVDLQCRAWDLCSGHVDLLVPCTWRL